MTTETGKTNKQTNTQTKTSQPGEPVSHVTVPTGNRTCFTQQLVSPPQGGF